MQQQIPLRLQRSLIALDLETTGIQPKTDRIIDLAAIKLYPDGRQEQAYWRCNPGTPIPAEATAVHGITDQDVAHCPTFATQAPAILQFLQDSDLTGFNILRFDIPMLQTEFSRCNHVFPHAEQRIIDSYRLYTQREPRDLASAMRHYCQRSLEQAHQAQSDAQAALDVLFGQLRMYADLPQDINQLHAVIHPQDPNAIDPDGKLRRVGGEIILTFGKYRNQPLRVVVEQDRGYLQWLLQQDFSPQVQQHLQAALEQNNLPLFQQANTRLL